MIDLRVVRDDPERIRRSQLARGDDPAKVDALLAADERRRTAVRAADELRTRHKALGKEIQRATPDARPALLAQASALAAEVKVAEAEQSAADETLREAHLALANVIIDGVPAGGEDDAIELARSGHVPELDFTPRDHVEIGELLRAIDTDRGAKVSGSRFFFLTGVGALLEIALLNLAVQQAEANGLTPVVTPALVKPSAMEGTGFLGPHSSEIYYLPADDLYLVGTSEVPLAALHSDEILDSTSLPLRYAGISSCFRREAGSHGRDVRGIIRVHQFDKVEMFTYCEPAAAEQEHERLLAQEREFLDKLEVAYRVVDIAAGDLGSSAARKFDCEAWMPSQGRYREVTSTSNCTTFQSRRLGTRMRLPDGSIEHVATLNGTLCAIARTIAVLLDHHQQPDGSVYVPVALRPLLGGRELLAPPA